MDKTHGKEVPQPRIESVQIGIAGMSCDKCAARVENALRNVSGVREVKVDRIGAIASVTFDHSQTNAAALHNAVTKAGYTPSALPQ